MGWHRFHGLSEITSELGHQQTAMQCACFLYCSSIDWCKKDTTATTGWTKTKIADSNGFYSKNMHFWPHVNAIVSCLFTIFKINVNLIKAGWLYLPIGVRNAYFQSYSHLNWNSNFWHGSLCFIKVLILSWKILTDLGLYTRISIASDIFHASVSKF